MPFGNSAEDQLKMITIETFAEGTRAAERLFDRRRHGFRYRCFYFHNEIARLVREQTAPQVC